MSSSSKEKLEEQCIYIDPISNAKLVSANRRGKIDELSGGLWPHEKEYIVRWRQAAGARPSDRVEDTLTGLAISGGGIRSAVFALGVTEALARANVMRGFDYLSTVSGGGYLGASLTWHCRQQSGQAAAGMQAADFPYPIDPPRQQMNRQSTPKQDDRLIYLRQHGKYLTPGNGIDLASGIAVVLRGMALNLLVWLPVMACVLLALMFWSMPDELVSFVALFPKLPSNGFAWAALVAACCAAFFLLCSIVYSLVTACTGIEDPWRYTGRRWFESGMRYFLWAFVAFVAIAFLPVLHDEKQTWLSAGTLSVVAGLISAAGTFVRSRGGGGASSGSLLSAVGIPLAAVLILYGILMIAYAWAYSLHEVITRNDCFAVQRGFPWLAGNCWALPAWWSSVAAVILALVTGHWVNVNLISVHRFYRDRLMEAFLPDSQPNRSKHYAREADTEKLYAFNHHHTAPNSPYHLINANLILVGSREPKWRLRGGDNFILSPLFCGSNATGWCSTRHFLGGDMTLATAMAISGAAANPYAGGGLFRNRPVALLMSLANLRLGYWVSHPKRMNRKAERRNHFRTTWRELTSSLHENGSLIQLSDGGHFENLGVYELVRRRVKLIVACDGTADPQFAFGDFVTLLSRISADFGARIEFATGCGLEAFMPSAPSDYPKDTKLATRGYTTGTIRYSDGSTGDIIYITTTLFKGLSWETLGYKAANSDFPDQTTADQFFDESQFEAYRDLGYCVGERVLLDNECIRILTKHGMLGSGAAPQASAANPQAA